MRTIRHAVGFALFFMLILLAACGESSSRRQARALADLQEWMRPEYIVDEECVRLEIKKCGEAWHHSMYTDAYAHRYYREGNPLVWATRMGIDERADTLLDWLRQAEETGLGRNVFLIDTLDQLLRQLRTFDLHDEGASRVLGRTEFLLTRAFLRYACGQRYGFVRPRQLLNHLLVDQPPAGETRPNVVYRQLYDQGSEEVSDSFVHHAIEEVRHHRLHSFLQEIQPDDTLYRLMANEYRRVRSTSDTTRIRQARINMERARWRYPRPSMGQYIWVNLAAQELTAVDTERDTMTTMRVCCGNYSHKTPLLHSAIRWVELNPYWVIPQSIVRKEIVPRHVGDSAYFARNSYRAVNKETKEEVDPALLTSADLKSARYTLRQERGAGNSLGRIIFRFPNNFSVFLHDTNNRSAFQYANRAISHGCIRVERPLDLALFFLDNPTPLYVDRIRMAIGLTPLSAEGLHYQEQHPDAQPLGSISLPKPVPVWLDYWTLYPTPQGQLQAFSDKYGYDKVIEKLLDSY